MQEPDKGSAFELRIKSVATITPKADIFAIIGRTPREDPLPASGWGTRQCKRYVSASTTGRSATTNRFNIMSINTSASAQRTFTVRSYDTVKLLPYCHPLTSRTENDIHGFCRAQHPRCAKAQRYPGPSEQSGTMADSKR